MPTYHQQARTMSDPCSSVALVIIGAGPAGLAPLFAAAHAGNLDRLLSRGVVILEQGTTPGAGSLREQAIDSDSYAATFADIVLHSREERLQALRTHPTVQALLSRDKSSAPLTLVSSFLELASGTLIDIVRNSRCGRLLQGVQALSVRREDSRHWQTTYRHVETGLHHSVRSHAVVVATGAHQPLSRLYKEEVAGVRLMPRFSSKLMQSGEVLAHGGVERVTARLRGKQQPKIIVLGGSTSATAVALHLLRNFGDALSAPASITLMHRSPLSLCFESVEQAVQEGYTRFSATDICSLSGRVFRLGGIRLDSKEMLMRVMGLRGEPREHRLHLLPLEGANIITARELLDQADLLIVAFGYRPRLLHVLDELGELIPLHEPCSGEWAVVDAHSRLLTSAGKAIPGLFATGLACGPAASPEMGGEQGFRGQVNSLWLWQHSLGIRLIQEICARCEPPISLQSEGSDDSSIVGHPWSAAWKGDASALPGILTH